MIFALLKAIDISYLAPNRTWTKQNLGLRAWESRFKAWFWPFFFFMTLLRHILLIIEFTYFKCRIQWFFSSTFTTLYSHHHKSVLGHFHPPNKVPRAHLQLIPLLSFYSWPQATNDLLSVSIDLPFLDISCTWTQQYVVSNIWFLSLRIVFEVHPCCSM